MLNLVVPIFVIVGVIAAVIIFLCSIYKVADIDKALIITGGKEPKIVVSGGSFVIPIFRKASYFDLCMLTVKADKDEIRTITSVPIVTDWTAQIRPEIKDVETLKKAIVSFKERGQEGIIEDVKLTLTGAVRDIVASMTPEAVLKDKTEFAQKVKETVSDEMKNMGMELVSLNIQDISDNNEYYDHLAALDMEEKRIEAEKKIAEANKEIRKQTANSEKEASQSELESELAIAEKRRDSNLKQAGYRAETDRANADAEIAGKLQTTIREQEVVEQEGRIAVIRQEQANLAATKEKEVIVTKAQAEKERCQIKAEAEASVKKIEAEAQVSVAEKEASAIKIKAEAVAEKTQKEGFAEAEVTKMNGIAEAEVIKQKGIAEAEAKKAELLAMAEGEKALADARASNEKVNFEIEKLKIDANARIEIATKTAQIMADIGKNAEFVNIGGGATSNNRTGNVFLDTLAGIPTLMKTLNVENQALNGKPISDEIYNLVASVAEPIKGLLSSNIESNNEGNDGCLDKT